jgi:hypothetical protein
MQFHPGASGAELFEAIEARAKFLGVPLAEFAYPLSTRPLRWLSQVRAAEKPQPATIERINALLAGRPVPAGPVNSRCAGSRMQILHAVVSPRDPPMPDMPRVDRDPCWRCGVRADVGCEHRVEQWGRAA